MNYANIFAKMFPERNFCKVNMFPERNFQVYEMFPEREIDDQFTHHHSRCSLRMDNLRQYALAMDQVCTIPILAVPLP